ncbi:MAG: glycosyltransferase family 2 protein [Halorhabdus sp.]
MTMGTSDESTRRDVSIVIPTCNRCTSLLRCLESISENTYPPERVEIVVVDGGEDRTQSRVREFADRTQMTVQYIDSSGDGNPAVARNRGAKRASHSLLLFCDSDCVVEPGWIRAHVKAHSTARGEVVVGPFFEAANGDVSVADHQARLEKERFGRYVASREEPLTIDARNFSTTDDAFRAIGGFDESLASNEDVEFGLRARQHTTIHFRRDARVHHWYPESIIGWYRRLAWHGYGAGQVLSNLNGSSPGRLLDSGQSDEMIFYRTARSGLLISMASILRSSSGRWKLFSFVSIVVYKLFVHLGARRR